MDVGKAPGVKREGSPTMGPARSRDHSKTGAETPVSVSTVLGILDSKV